MLSVCVMEPLSDEQKNSIRAWIEEGLAPGDIQKQIKETFGIPITYLDLRLILDDLKVVPKEKPGSEEPDAKDAETPAEQAELEPVDSDDLGGAPSFGKVSVSIDQITRPNALVSGKVVFSDGQKADWSLDQTGRLALDPATPGYRPTQDDVMAFQMELQNAARSAGI